MIRRFITIIAALAIAAFTASASVALAQHHSATHHARAIHHVAAKHAAVDATGESLQTSGESQESATEQASDDGPGGYEDLAGAEVDHPFEGVE